MSRRFVQSICLGLTCLIAGPLLADGGRGERFEAKLRPSEEVPSISSAASGDFSLRIDASGDSLHYKLRYEELEGTVTQAHIHFGDTDTNGGISIWLCSNLASPVPTPPGVQACPLPPASIDGEIRAADVVGPAGQGIRPNELAEIVRAIRRGLAYANVHSSEFPGGEIRGQIKRESRDNDD
jgi:hypothetical protein